MASKFIAALALLFLAACSSEKYSPYGGTDDPTQVKIGKAYEVKGETYTPSYDANYTEEGTASWYGPKFHGRMTASGEKYDKHEMTAAHRTLPMPSIVRVTNLGNGRAVKVRVNDRGPFSKRRIIDLSQAAAEELDMIRTGTARVRVEYLSADTEQFIASMGLKKPEGWGGSPTTFAAVPAGDIISSDVGAPGAMPAIDVSSEPKPLMQSSIAIGEAPLPAVQPTSFSMNLIPASTAYSESGVSRYRIQAGSFGNAQNAERVAGDLRTLGEAYVRPVMSNGLQYYRVSIGPLNQYADAERLLERVRSMGYRDARIMVDDS